MARTLEEWEKKIVTFPNRHHVTALTRRFVADLDEEAGLEIDTNLILNLLKSKGRVSKWVKDQMKK